VAGSAQLLQALASDGVDVVAVTPFVPTGAAADMPVAIRERVGALRGELHGRGVPALIPGAEIELGWALAADEQQLRAATYGQLGKTLLVSTPARGMTADFDDMVLNLSLRGFQVLLAHPESNRAYQDQPVRLGRLVREGALLQIDAESILAPEGSRSRRLAFALLQEGAAHVIASNARGAVRPRFREAVEAAEQVAGARARWMVTDAPAAILGGAELPEPPRTEAARGGLLKRLLGG
jgi:protein-tyrosine phosphatase